MKLKQNIWPFGKGQPLGRKTTHHRRATKPVSEKALAKQAKERESERLERKLSDEQLEAKLRKHYSRGGNLREFLQANPGIPGAQLKRCNAVAGRKRARKRNPSSDAAAVYEEFHGRPSSEVVTVTEKIHYHKNLAALGELRTLIVQARDGARVTLTRFKKAILCTNEAKNQLFVRGGDQSVDLQSFGIRTAHEIETLGRVSSLPTSRQRITWATKGGRRCISTLRVRQTRTASGKWRAGGRISSITRLTNAWSSRAAPTRFERRALTSERLSQTHVLPSPCDGARETLSVVSAWLDGRVRSLLRGVRSS
jgi:hypothetical protein